MVSLEYVRVARINIFSARTAPQMYIRCERTHKTAWEQHKNPLHLQCSNNQFAYSWAGGGEKRRKHFRKWEKYLLCHYIGFASAKILASSSTSLLSSRNNAAGGWADKRVLCFKFKLRFSALNEINLWAVQKCYQQGNVFRCWLGCCFHVYCNLFSLWIYFFMFIVNYLNRDEERSDDRKTQRILNTRWDTKLMSDKKQYCFVGWKGHQLIKPYKFILFERFWI